jgi:hypothetical protein
MAPLSIDTYALDNAGKLVVSMTATTGWGRAGPVPAGFDPWAATYSLEECLSQMDTPAFAQWVAAQSILKMRDTIETKADGVATLKAVHLAVLHGLVAPLWLSNAFDARFTAFDELRCASLDEAFGNKPLGPKKLAAYRKRVALILKVSRHLCEAIKADPERAIEVDGLFTEVGEKLGLGKTKCRELYDEGRKKHGLQDLNELKRVLRSGVNKDIDTTSGIDIQVNVAGLT